MRCIAGSAVMLAGILLVSGCQNAGVASEKAAAVEKKAGFAAAKPTYWIVGDSTVRNGSGNRVGWGEVISPLFDPNRIKVVNKAIGGRSTRNYIAQGRWKDVLDNAKPGDYVTVQFGHNDRGRFTGPKGDRGVLPGIGEETQEVTPDPNKPDQKVVVHTYGWYLRQYVSDARGKGLTIILVTPVARNNWETDSTLKNDIRPWAEYMREVGKQEKVLVLDLNAIIARHYSEMGKDKVDGVFFEGTDQTHTTKVGAEFNAKCVAEGLRKLDGCNLKHYLIGK
jgi:rhamnogalacturonan acetylesterase